MKLLVKFWSGKWHVYARDIKTVPAQPVSTYNRVAKPERLLVLAQCGETGYKKDQAANLEFNDRGVAFHNKKRTVVCNRCYPFIRNP